MVSAWVAFWNRTEHGRSLALVRIGLGLVVLFDLLDVWRLGLVVPLFAPQEAGGWADVASRGHPFPWSVLPAEPSSASLCHGALVLAALAVTVGFFTRTSTLALLLLWAAWRTAVPEVDRAVDQLCRDLLAILVLSGAGRTLSVDAWLRTRSFDDPTPIGSWARYLVIAQVVVAYFAAGLQKLGLHWLPMGDFGALYVILQDPAIARFDFGFLGRQPWYLLTQLGTAVTFAWQLLYPLVLLWLYYASTAERPGRLRAFANRLHLHHVWIGVGVFFHLALAATTELGIFPWAMLVAYLAFLEPPRG